MSGTLDPVSLGDSALVLPTCPGRLFVRQPLQLDSAVSKSCWKSPPRQADSCPGLASQWPGCCSEPGKGIGKPALGAEDHSGPVSWPQDRQPRSPPRDAERTHRCSLWMSAGVGTVPLPAPNQTLRQSSWDGQGGLLETRFHVICSESSQLFPAAWTLTQRMLQHQPGVGPPLLPSPPFTLPLTALL